MNQGPCRVVRNTIEVVRSGRDLTFARVPLRRRYGVTVIGLTLYPSTSTTAALPSSERIG
jgi:hypothetical protein